MNKSTGKWMSIVLCIVLCLTCTGVALAQTTQLAISKDETVYVLAGADGGVQKIIVSDWIQNWSESNTIFDRSDLTDIENVKGTEDCSMDDDHLTVWNAQGNDIYYQGIIDKELPVNLIVSYTLDEQPVSAEEIAGKSGRVAIRFDYQNTQYEMAQINGEKTKIYVPFAALTGLLLDSDTFQNVEVSNGKLLDDGDHTLIIGLAFTGLQEDLGIDNEDLDIRSFVEVTADVTDFELGSTITFVSNEVFNALDTDHISLSDMDNSLSELTDAVTQLLDRSSALYDGLCTLLLKSNDLAAGVNTLAEGTEALDNGIASLSSGADALQSGAEELSNGLNTLSSNSAVLNSSAAQIFNRLLSTASTQIQAAGIPISDLTVENYADILNEMIASLDETGAYSQVLQQVTAAVEEKQPEITKKVTAAMQEQVTQQVTESVQAQVSASVYAEAEAQAVQQVLQSLGMTKEVYDTDVIEGQISEQEQTEIEAAIATQLSSEEMQSLIAEAIREKMADDEIQETIVGHVEVQMQSETIQETIAQTVNVQLQQAISETMISDAVQSQLSAASENAKAIIELKTSLDCYNAFYLGMLSYTTGVDQAASGAGTLSDGAISLNNGVKTLKTGSDQLCSGMLTLQDGIPALIDGVTELRDGAMALSDGMKQLNEEGIQKLASWIDEDLDGFTGRLTVTIDASKRYTNFSGIGENTDGQVKFVYRTEEIKNPLAN